MVSSLVIAASLLPHRTRFHTTGADRGNHMHSSWDFRRECPSRDRDKWRITHRPAPHPPGACRDLEACLPTRVRCAAGPSRRATRFLWASGSLGCRKVEAPPPMELLKVGYLRLRGAGFFTAITRRSIARINSAIAQMTAGSKSTVTSCRVGWNECICGAGCLVLQRKSPRVAGNKKAARMSGFGARGYAPRS